MVGIKMIALVLSLGLDTLLTSISLGFSRTSGRLRIAATFALAEAIMPLIGVLIGQGAGRLIGGIASWVGGIALILVAIWMVLFDDDDDDDDDQPNEPKNLVGWTLIVTALSISLDELAVGFSMGLMGIPIVLTIVLICLQAFIFTVLGLTFARRLKRFVGEWAEKLAGAVLGLLGVWIIVDRFLT